MAMEVLGPVEWPIKIQQREPVYYDIYYTEFGNDRYVIVTKGGLEEQPVPLRIESACVFGHIFRGVQCDCGDQMEQALVNIAKREHGLLIYAVDDDARGHGMKTHIELYVKRQHHGMDEEDIFEEMGEPMDVREYDDVIDILDYFGVHSVELMTNNPERIEVLEQNGVTVEERIPLEAEITEYNQELLLEEKEWMGYMTGYRTHEEWREFFEEKRSDESSRNYLATVDHRKPVDKGFPAGGLDDIDLDGVQTDDSFVTLYVDFEPDEDQMDDLSSHIDEVKVISDSSGLEKTSALPN